MDSPSVSVQASLTRPSRERRAGERRQRAELGCAEPWLRALGLLTWGFLGVDRLWPDRALLHHTAPGWLGPWFVYGVALIGAGLHRRLPRWLRIALLAVQAAAALRLPGLGFRGFEGLLLSIVAVQVPTVLSLTQSVAWTLGQLPFLVAIVWPFKRATEVMEIVGAYSAFSAFALLVYWLHQQEVKARRALAHAHADLLATRALILDGARQSERLRISRELHDSLGHHLIAIGLQLELAEQLVPGVATESVSRARSISREALTEVRRVVAAMQHADGLDLLAMLKALAAGIPAPRIHIAGDAARSITDRQASHALFRCVQEAITNSLKHAGARNIWVAIEQTAQRLEIDVRDDGRGADAVVAGNGLLGIRARLAPLGGRAEFRCGAGTGFAVHLTVPVFRTGR